ncbi:putative chromosome segregation protein [Phaeomoniella chlamydospora]|uniref:Putative chromosome segregation protein n=1 Tax=Phaeomoniella chlamydospora TaxID=158046 RepID=A0A0G2EQW7_PHACM|nr:putative chromosome segregation protein [Phaeomoniella chlamydospora]
MDISNQSKTGRPKSRQSIAFAPTGDCLTNDKENGTVDISALQRKKDVSAHGQKKKSRSKSLGPGGLEALKENTGNAVKTPISLPKSILKPTVPITPPKAIPSFEATRRKNLGPSSGRGSPAKNGGEDLLIDFSTPAISTGAGTVSGSQNLVDPFSPSKAKSPHPTDVAQHDDQAAVMAKETEERRQAEKKAVLEQRAARRKSMANRRVSFAPEATLHTWNVVELAEDSTTSSASNSTRRQSSMTAAQSPGPSSDPPSTPTSQDDEPLVRASPAHQRDLHQKKRRRRSSGIPPMNFNNPDDDVDFSSSPFSESSVGGESSPVAVDDSINSDDDLDDDDDTAMSIDDVTAQSGISVGSSTVSSLDERLAAAANHAGTRGIDYDENGDEMSMELATGTVTHAFQPWAKKSGNLAQDFTSSQDQENMNPFSPAFKAQVVAQAEQRGPQEDDSTQDMSMDMTAAVGGILSQTSKSPLKNRRKSVTGSRRRSSVARRRSSGEASSLGDETMDLTTVGGGIVQTRPSIADDESMIGEDEEMTMEFTNVVGGLMQNGSPQTPSKATDQGPADTSEMDQTMEMTAAFGSILPSIEEHTEPFTDDEGTQAMDITKAIGSIMPPHMNSASKNHARHLMEQEAEAGHLHVSPFHEYTAPDSLTPSKSAIPDRVATSVASETGSPSLAMKPRLSGRKAPAPRQSTTPKATMAGTPVKGLSVKVGTPTKQVTPQPARPETPEKTPIMPNVTYRSASPKKLFKDEIKARASPASAQKSHKKNALFARDAETGAETPSVVLAPKPHQHLRRRSSGLGIDKDGMGSPRVSALLDRRGSIGEGANTFVPDPFASRAVHFDDPRKLTEQVDAEREEEERRESGRFIMEQEADGEQDDENATLQLKEMIQSMTPRKNKLKGRKSLAVGGAKGLLGKRPAELDTDDDEAAEITPKRLKVIENQASPVKRIHLPAPPTKAETTGRMTRAKRKSLEETTANALTPSLRKSPGKNSAANTPKNHGRFKDTPLQLDAARPTSFEDRLDNVMDAVDASIIQVQQQEKEVVEEKIHLQDFLNMTNIHFMELNTTKRRHTIAPGASDHTFPTVGPANNSACLPECVTAATTTLPLLELYQHACRELKSYISSGRRIIRSIEQETFDEQPPLFREYLDARPDVKMVMDNQFRNGKVNARLQSKAGWYAWRSQLVDGLKGGLDGIKAGMIEDSTEIGKQKEMLDSILPGLEQRQSQLESEDQHLTKRKDDLDNEDHEALREARTRLARLSKEMKEKNDILIELRAKANAKESELSQAAEDRAEFEAQIAEAERVQEECRGLSLKDVKSAKDIIEDIVKRTGWKILSAEEDEDYVEAHGPALTMCFQDSLRLFFFPAAFQSDPQARRRSRSRASTAAGAPISLTYAPTDTGHSGTIDLPTEKRFMLQFLRSHLHALASQPKGSVSTMTLLNYIKNGWNLISKITEEVRLLQIMGVTDVAILGDETLGAKCSVMLPNGKGRVDVAFHTTVSPDGDGDIPISVVVDIKAHYGSVMGLVEKKREKVVEALGKEMEGKELGEGSWVGAVKGFEEWVSLQKTDRAIPTPARSKTPRRK